MCEDQQVRQNGAVGECGADQDSKVNKESAGVIRGGEVNNSRAVPGS